MIRLVPSNRTAIRTEGLGKRYGRTWALQECDLTVPRGRVCGLVGANGAGKSTLLRLLVGLARPTTGRVEVLGHPPADRPDFLASVGYVAQSLPLQPRWTAAEHVTWGGHTNLTWSAAETTDRLRRRGVPLDRRVGTLSGGQRAQLGLALALGKAPQLLLLDEPVAALDPLARRDFLATLTEAVSERETTVVLSSHLVADLERVCDHVVALSASRTVLAGDLDTILEQHRLVTVPLRQVAVVERDHLVLRREDHERHSSLWVRLNGPLADPRWTAHPLDLEDIVLTYLGRSTAESADRLVSAGAGR